MLTFAAYQCHTPFLQNIVQLSARSFQGYTLFSFLLSTKEIDGNNNYTSHTRFPPQSIAIKKHKYNKNVTFTETIFLLSYKKMMHVNSNVCKSSYQLEYLLVFEIIHQILHISKFSIQSKLIILESIELSL